MKLLVYLLLILASALAQDDAFPNDNFASFFGGKVGNPGIKGIGNFVPPGNPFSFDDEYFFYDDQKKLSESEQRPEVEDHHRDQDHFRFYGGPETTEATIAEMANVIISEDGRDYVKVEEEPPQVPAQNPVPSSQPPVPQNQGGPANVADDVIGYYLNKKKADYERRQQERRPPPPPNGRLPPPPGHKRVRSPPRPLIPRPPLRKVPPGRPLLAQIRQLPHPPPPPAHRGGPRKPARRQLMSPAQPNPYVNQIQVTPELIEKERQVEKVEKLIPNSVKDMIKTSGKKIVRSFLEPERDDPSNSIAERWLRTTFLANIYPAFAPEHVTVHLVAQWVNVMAITFAWIFVGAMFSTTTAAQSGRQASGTGLASEAPAWTEQPWSALVPDSSQVAFVLRELAGAADRWSHDELWFFVPTLTFIGPSINIKGF